MGWLNKHRMIVALAVAGVAVVASPRLPSAAIVEARTPGEAYLARVDHLVFATPDLNAGIESVERLLGVHASAGGQHPGLGTRNALVALGPLTYLEIIGPDPAQPRPSGLRRFGIDDLRAPRLVGWVAKEANLEQLFARARRDGVMLGDVISGSRKRPDGALLFWRYTDPAVVIEDRLIPYFIDWGSSPHPAAGAAPGASLVGLRAEHPDASRVQRMLHDVGLELPVTRGSRPALVATIDGRKGRVELRGSASPGN